MRKSLFFAFLLPMALLIGGLAWWYGHAQREILIEHYRTEARHHVEGQLKRIDRIHRQAAAMLRALARDKQILPSLAGDAAAIAAVRELFADIAHTDALYDQIRLLDRKGQEIIRVERTGGRVHIATARELQRKSGRYYVRRTLALPAGRMFVSPFDLNVEHGRVQRPLKPVLRLAVAIDDEEGNRRGMLVLNLAGMAFVKRELNETVLAGEHLLIKSGAGFWFDRVDGALRVLPVSAGDPRLPQHYPHVWERIRRRSRGQMLGPAGLFTHAVIVPVPGMKHAAEIRRPWYVVSFVPAAALATGIRRARRTVFPVAIFCLVLATVAAAAVSGWIGSRKEAMRKLRDSEERFRHLVESNVDPMLIQHRGQIVYANPAAVEQLGASSATAIQGMNMHNFLHPIDRYLAVSHLEAAAVKGARTQPAEVRLRRLDGSWMTVEIACCPFAFRDRPSVLTVWHDITARKHHEREMEHLSAENERLAQGLIRLREEERTRLARSLHDEIGQRLTAVQLQAASLSSRCTDKAIRGGLRRIQNQAGELIDVVRGQLTARSGSRHRLPPRIGAVLWLAPCTVRAIRMTGIR